MKKNNKTHLIIALFLAVFFSNACAAKSEQETVLVQSTTSTANSGLYDYLLPLFEEQTGIKVNVVAVGTGQAIRNAQNCDADVLLVHAKSAEEAFVANGFGVERFNLMYNDFVIIGPKNDPAKVQSSTDAAQALKQIYAAQVPFASRGDDSGTHKKELSLWQSINVDTENADIAWYRSTGSGMGATINTAVGLAAYTLTDRATWISFGNKSDFEILLEGDPALFNQYGVVLVNSQKCPTANSEAGQKLIDWLLSAKAQEKIAEFSIAGQQLFYPNADRDLTPPDTTSK